MNKLFSKIASLSVGLAMAVGVGVALGHESVKVAKAAEYSAYKLDGSVVTAVSGDPTYSNDSNYNNESVATQNELSWGADGNTTMNPWRIGGKGENGYVVKTYDRYVYSKAEVSTEDIEKIEFKVGNTSSASSFTINSFSLTVSSEEKGGGTIESSDNSKTITANSTITFNRPEGKDWSNKFFCFAVNISCKGGKSSSSNLYFQLISIEFFYSVDVQEPDSVTVSGDSSVGVGGSISLTSEAKYGTSSEGVNQNVVWSSSNPGVAKVDSDGHVTGVKNGQATIKATAENVPSVYGEKVVTVSGGKSDDSAIAITPDDLPTAYGDNYRVIGGTYFHAKQIMKNDGVIQIQKTNGLFENVAAFDDDIKTVELSFNADKTQGSGFAVKVSTDGETFSALGANQLYSNRFEYTCSTVGAVYLMISAPTSGTLYLDEILIGFGNSSESKLVALSAALNDLLDSECTGSSDATPITAEKWSDVEAAYNGGDSTAKSELAGIDSLSYIEVNQFLERYDHIVSAYGYSNFLERDVPAQAHMIGFEYNNNSYIIIIVISAISVMSFGLALFLRKKRSK